MAKTEKFELKTRVSEEALATLAKTMADKKVEFNTKKLELSNIRSRYNKEIIALDEEITELADQVHTKHHVEKLDCPLNPLPASKRMELLHPNTGEVVHTRPMTADEAKEGYLFEGINDPEDSAKNAKAFLKKKGRDAEPEEFDSKFVNDGTDPSDPESEDNSLEGFLGREMPGDGEPPEPIGEIEAGGEQFHKKDVKVTPVEFDADLDFSGVFKVATDEGGGFHFGYRFASTKSKGSVASPVYVNGVTYTDYQVMLDSAAAIIIGKITSEPRLKTMTNERTNRITKTIEKFFEPEAAEAVAGD